MRKKGREKKGAKKRARKKMARKKGHEKGARHATVRLSHMDHTEPTKKPSILCFGS